MKALAEHCIARVLHGFEADLRMRQPNITDKEVLKAIKKERVYLLPSKTKDDEVGCMIRLLKQRFDVNRTGYFDRFSTDCCSPLNN